MHKSSVTVVGFIGNLDLFWPRFTRSLKQQYVYMHLQVEAFYKSPHFSTGTGHSVDILTSEPISVGLDCRYFYFLYTCKKKIVFTQCGSYIFCTSHCLVSRRYGFSRTYALMFLFAEQQTKLCTYLFSVKCCAITCLFTKIATNYQ